MPKPAPYRLSPGAYPYATTLQTRFGDMDLLGHLNNVAYAALFENGRVRFNRDMGSRQHREPGERWLVASVGIEYLREGYFPDDVILAAGIGRIGRTSWTIEQAMFQREQCIATADSVLVYSGKEGTKALPEELVRQLEARRTRSV